MNHSAALIAAPFHIHEHIMRQRADYYTAQEPKSLLHSRDTCVVTEPTAAHQDSLITRGGGTLLSNRQGNHWKQHKELNYQQNPKAIVRIPRTGPHRQHTLRAGVFVLKSLIRIRRRKAVTNVGFVDSSTGNFGMR